MHHPTPNICVEFETNRLVSYSATARVPKYFSTSDGQTDGTTNSDLLGGYSLKWLAPIGSEHS